MSPVTKAVLAVASLPLRAVKSLFSLTEGGWVDRVGSTIYGWGVSLGFGGWWGSPYRKLAEAAYTNPTAHRALRLIAQAAAEAPVYVERRDGSTWDADESEAHAHVLDLWERPNARTSRESAMLAITTALYCGGEFWVDKAAPSTGPNAGRALSLRLIMPDEFRRFLREPETGDVVGYEFQSRAREGVGARTYTRTVDECLHVRLFHPLDEDRGLAVLVGAAAEIEHMGKAVAWNAAIAEGGGKVKGIWMPKNLEPGQQLSREDVDTAQAMLNEKLRQAQANNEEIVGSGAFERAPGDVTPKDADWMRSLAWDVRMIAALMGVPPALIGDEKGGSLTDAGVDSEVRALYLLTVLPLLGFVLAEVSRFLLPPGYRLAVDLDQIPALSEDMDAKAERFAMLYREGVFGLAETRTALGYEEDAPDDLKRPAPSPIGLASPEEDAPPEASSPVTPEDPPDDAEASLRYLRSLTDPQFSHALAAIAA